MGTVGERIIFVGALVATGLVAYLVYGWLINVNILTLSPLAIGIIAVSGLTIVATVVLWWYVPMSRPPHKMPMWNDQYHRKGLRAAKAITYALFSGAIAALIVLIMLVALLPGWNAPATSVVAGGVVENPREYVAKRGWVLIRFEKGSARGHVYPCRPTRCMRGYTPTLAAGEKLDFEISRNWVGSSIVGLVRHGV